MAAVHLEVLEVPPQKQKLVNERAKRFADGQAWARGSASRNLLIISKRDPENSPEYSEFVYLQGNHWHGGVPLAGTAPAGCLQSKARARGRSYRGR